MQRRHQKIIEESPSVLIDTALRAQMEAVAIQAARAVGYIGAGTVEFIADVDSDGQVAGFYFLEMNTRLQVEHPVTELRFGVDLVALQVHIATGRPLPTPEPPMPRGHSIEVRVCAEHPRQQFAPQPGTILQCYLPSGPGVRVDTGVGQGDRVTPFYDPLLMKIITWGQDREEARLRMVRALRETRILGITTNIDFLLYLLTLPAFCRGTYHTATIAETLPDYQQQTMSEDFHVAMAAIHHFRRHQEQGLQHPGNTVDSTRIWVR